MRSSGGVRLHCPYCGDPLEPERDTGIDGYGILACSCSRYPCVAGIPVLKTHATGGRPIQEVVGLLERGRNDEALLAMLTPWSSSPPPSASLRQRLAALPGLGRLHGRRWRRSVDVWRQQLARMLAQRDAVTALEMLDLYHRRGPTTPLAEAYNYCAFRFSQPRHLVGLALFGLIRPAGPIVELACGYGHMTASLVRVAQGKPVIGIDQNFFFLFVAKHWIAPEASFICYGMEAALPFAGAAFSAAVCVDGIHFIKNKTTTVREIKRQLAADGVMILASSRNAAIAYPYAGHPLTAEGYRRLVADTPHRLVRDSDVLDSYLTGRRPSLVRSASSAELAAAPLISIIASHRADVFNDSGMLETWPHGEGWLGVNPLYVAERRGREGAILRRVFPSAFYLDDNPEMAAYLPEEVAVSGEVLTALDEGRRTPEVARLIEQYVVLGLPERYAGARFPDALLGDRRSA